MVRWRQTHEGVRVAGGRKDLDVMMSCVHRSPHAEYGLSRVSASQSYTTIVQTLDYLSKLTQLPEHPVGDVLRNAQHWLSL